MQTLLENLTAQLTAEELNTLTYKFLDRAYAQMEDGGDLLNGDKIAQHIEDYYTYYVTKK